MELRSQHPSYPLEDVDFDDRPDLPDDIEFTIRLHQPSPSPSLLPSPDRRKLVSPVMSTVDEQSIPPVPPLPPNFMRKSLGVQQRRDEFDLGTSPPSLARRHSDPPISASSPPSTGAASDDGDAINSITTFTPPPPQATCATQSGSSRSPQPAKPVRRRVPPPTHLFDGPVTPPEACYAPRTPPEAACMISLEDAPPLPGPVNGITLLPSASSISVTTPTAPKWFENAKPPAGYADSIMARYGSYNQFGADRGDRRSVVGATASDGDIRDMASRRRSPPSLASNTTQTCHSGLSTSTINSLPPTPRTSRGVSVIYNERSDRKETMSWAAPGRYSTSSDQPRQSMDHGWPSPPQASDDGHVHAHQPCPDLTCSSNEDHQEVMLGGSTEMTDEELKEMEQFMAEAVEEQEQWIDEEVGGIVEDEEEDEDVSKRDRDPSWTWQKPSRKMVQKAAECSLSDEFGNELKFGDLLPGSDADVDDAASQLLSPVDTNETAPARSLKSARSQTRVNELPKPPKYTKTVVFFVGHWWCGLCHDYVLMSLAKLSPAALLRAGVKVCVISSGTWKAITKYKEMFNIPATFNVYVDRGTRLYKALGMRTRMPNPFPELKVKFRPGYHRHAFLRQMATGMSNGFFRLTGFTNPGNFMQLGGEFVFSDDFKCDFAHRMAARSGECSLLRWIHAAPQGCRAGRQGLPAASSHHGVSHPAVSCGGVDSAGGAVTTLATLNAR